MIVRDQTNDWIGDFRREILELVILAEEADDARHCHQYTNILNCSSVYAHSILVSGMALNLISSYDSDSDSVSSGDEKPPDPEHVLEDEASQSAGKQKCSFFFGGEEGSSTDEEKDQLAETQPLGRNECGSSSRLLPSAGSVLKGKYVGSSVFSSEREQEDLVQQFTLSQHVPLTEKVETKKKPLCRCVV
ncbi:hypothetical protein NECAME_13489 [Necator americanus]|uniref:Uncharacterized protein n=1 Tax=Necator americanus TaxID=51031 RepID=W2SV88_NECAM|nr:hypothetical protein NECAME_13489 [Necator americanus]ETN73550.1 hypothetical protein NECAME_13489 [Necator americanus]